MAILSVKEQLKQDRQKLSDIKLRSRRDYFDPNRTVASETGLPEDALAVYAGSVSRWTGTGYKDDYYRPVIAGKLSDDAIIIHRVNGTVDNLFRDDAEIDRDFFARRREYGRKIAAASREHKLPYEVCLAVGEENCAEFAALTRGIVRVPGGVVGTNSTGFGEDIHKYELNITAEWELDCGIGRRKSAILALMPDMSDALRFVICGMGQINSRRVARYIMSLDNPY